jgi:dolichol kinase
MAYIKEILRKGIHLGSLIIPVMAVYVPKMEMVLFLAALGLALILVDILKSRNSVFRRFFLEFFGKVLRDKEHDGAMTASTVLVASAALTILLFRTEIAVTSLVFLSVGDSMAALVGKKFGKTPLVSGRTLEGSLAALLSCLIASILILHVSASRGWTLTPAGLLAGAIAATLAELFEVPLDDNLRIPVFAGLVMELVIPG